MRYLLLSLLFLFKFFNSSAQSEWSVGLSLSPDYTFMYMQGLKVNSIAKPLIKYTIGLDVNRNVSENFWVSTGIWYSSKGFVIKNMPDLSSPRDEQGNIIPELLKYVDMKEIYNYFEIPVLVNYRFEKPRKMNLFISVGAVFGYLYESKIKGFAETYRWKGNDVNIWFNRLSYNLTGSIGIYHPVNDKYILTFGPNFVFSIRNVRKDSNTKVYLHSLGLRMSVSMKL